MEYSDKQLNDCIHKHSPNALTILPTRKKKKKYLEFSTQCPTMMMQTVIHIHIFSDILVLQASQFLDVNQYEKKECMGRFFFANETFEIMYL